MLLSVFVFIGLFISAAQTKKDKDEECLLVVGAGMSGIAAAHHLSKHQQRWPVVVVEAQTYIGGHIFTDRQTFAGRSVDMGGAFLMGRDENPLYDLVLQADIRTTVLDEFSTFLFDQNGTRLSLAESYESLLTAYNVFDDAGKYGANQTRDMSVYDAMDYILNHDGEHYTERQRQYVRNGQQMIGGILGKSLHELSIQQYDKRIFYEGYDLLMTDGFLSILDYLIQDGNFSIHLNHPVFVIQQNQTVPFCRPIRILLTVPLGVLKSRMLTFIPPLPIRKQKAIQHLGWAHVQKVAIEFQYSNDTTALKDVVMFSRFNDSVFCASYLLPPSNGTQILLGVIGGEQSQITDRLSLVELQQLIMADLIRISPHFPTPIAITTTRFSTNPYLRGAYLAMTLGATEADIDTLAEPVSNWLFFAGEATTKQKYATVHGAYESGIRAARELLDTL